MAIPQNGNISNPAPDGYFVNKRRNNRIDPLHKPTWGFNDTQFMQNLPSDVWNVSTTSQLITALDDADDNGGGTINLLSGTIDANQQLTYPSNTLIQGAGIGETLLRAGSHDGNLWKNDYQGNIVIRDMSIDCQRKVGRPFFFIACGNILVERIDAYNSSNSGIIFRSSQMITLRYSYSRGHANNHGVASKDIFGDSDLTRNLGSYGAYHTNSVLVYSNEFTDNNLYGFDFHTGETEVCGNITAGGEWGNKTPDAINLYCHDNIMRNSPRFGVRCYQDFSGISVPGRTQQNQNYYDNLFQDVGTALRINESTDCFIGWNEYSNVDTNANITDSNVYTAAGTQEAGFSNVSINATRGAEIQALRDLRDTDSGGGDDTGTGTAPYADSEVITAVEWDATGNIIDLGDGSRNWITTWADDGNLYTAYGDGQGFVPNVPAELSLGFAKVFGTPPSISGENIESDDEVAEASGADGKKISGILAVDGTLYAWVRNANGDGEHCQLWSSADDAENWTQHFTLTEFGFISFVNFGQDYAGAKDTYVYALTPNGSSAYVAYDEFVLMRVPKASITTESAWEYYTGTNANGNPTWGAKASRTSVFDHTSKCLRHNCTYNAGLGRFLWWQQVPGTGGASPPDTSASGGFGLYESQDPWGPWRTVFYTESWDEGPGDVGHFPTKWMSTDGKECYLVFSGDDSFRARKATFTAVGTEGTPEQGTISVRVASGDSDAEEVAAGGEVRINSTDLDMCEQDNAETVGIRFRANVPYLSTIISAYITFTAVGTSTEATSLTFNGEDIGDSPAFTATLEDISSRTTTTASVAWSSIGQWAGESEYQTPNLSTIVQEIVNRADWAANNYLSFIVTGTGKRKAYSYEASPSKAPQLVIEYQADPLFRTSLKSPTLTTYTAAILVDDEVILQTSTKALAVSKKAATFDSGVIVGTSVKAPTLVTYTATIEAGDELAPLSAPGPVGGGAIVEEV